MRSLILILLALMLLSACSAKVDNPQSQTESPQAVDIPAVAGETPLPATPAPEAEKPVAQPETDKPKQVTPLVTFIELGAESCIPCKMMQPILKEVSDEYQGLVKVIFIDLYKDKQAAQKYQIRVMPTQVFLDAKGREVFRHEGFYPKAEIEKMLADKFGVTKP